MRGALLVAACAVAGCYSPHYKDCEISCASNDCPAGLECHEGMCRVGGMTGSCSMMQPDAPAPPPIPLDMVAAAQLDAFCTYLARCRVFEDLAACKSTLDGNFGAANTIAAVTAGKVIYDGDKARQCFDALATLTCDRESFASNRTPPAACTGIFRGTIGDQGVCALDEECISGVCKVGTCNTSCCTGTCIGSTPPGMPTLGQSCTGADHCVDSYCDANGTCAAYKMPGAVCASTGECAVGLMCQQSPAGPMMCTPLVPTMGACGSTEQCASLSDVCRSNICTTGGLTSSPCASAAECQLAHPCSAAGTTNGQCQLPPTLNEPCTTTSYCRDGYCSAASGTCQPKLADGMPCDPVQGGDQCQGNTCDMTTNRCVTPPACI